MQQEKEETINSMFSGFQLTVFSLLETTIQNVCKLRQWVSNLYLKQWWMMKDLFTLLAADSWRGEKFQQ